MNANAPSPTGSPLSIPGMLAEVYTLLWSNRDGFLRVVLVPAAASFVLTVIAYHLAGSPILLLFLAVDVIPTTLFAVGWHRLILLGPQRTQAEASVRWGRRESAYLLRVLVLAVGSALAMAVPVSIAAVVAQRSPLGHLILLAISFTALFVMVRLALVLPASAVDAPYGFSQAWNDTARRGFRLVAIVLLVGIPLFLLLQLFNSAASALGLAAAAPFTLVLLNSVGGYVMLAALLTVFALAFRRLSGWQGGGPAPVPGG